MKIEIDRSEECGGVIGGGVWISFCVLCVVINESIER